MSCIISISQGSLRVKLCSPIILSSFELCVSLYLLISTSSGLYYISSGERSIPSIPLRPSHLPLLRLRQPRRSSVVWQRPLSLLLDLLELSHLYLVQVQATLLSNLRHLRGQGPGLTAEFSPLLYCAANTPPLPHELSPFLSRKHVDSVCVLSPLLCTWRQPQIHPRPSSPRKVWPAKECQRAHHRAHPLVVGRRQCAHLDSWAGPQDQECSLQQRRRQQQRRDLSI